VKKARGYQHASFKSKLGECFVAARAGKVFRIDFGVTEKEFLRKLAQRYGIESSEAAGALDPVVRQLSEYFSGKRRKFEFGVSLLEGTDFEKTVWKQLARIPFGETRSYGELARAAGVPGAARAVGRAMGKNPLPIVLPCHRVIRSDGSLGGFGMGIDAKQDLLKLEGVIR
jgi:methylated-DNA-[protein]-cysteine S-methyltransferase